MELVPIGLLGDLLARGVWVGAFGRADGERSGRPRVMNGQICFLFLIFLFFLGEGSMGRGWKGVDCGWG